MVRQLLKAGELIPTPIKKPEMTERIRFPEHRLVSSLKMLLEIPAQVSVRITNWGPRLRGLHFQRTHKSVFRKIQAAASKKDAEMVRQLLKAGELIPTPIKKPEMTEPYSLSHFRLLYRSRYQLPGFEQLPHHLSILLGCSRGQGYYSG
jgi:hypothetical protein